MSVLSTSTPYNQPEQAFPQAAFDLLQAPMTLEELGIPEALVQDLALKRALIAGTLTIRSLARALHLTVPVGEAVFRILKDLKLIEVKGMVGDDYRFSLTTQGRELALERYRISHYAAAAPVPLQQYHRVVRAQASRTPITRAELEVAFRDLVVPKDLLDQIGPAFNTQRSIFLYGPSGNGKTSIAERLWRVYQDAVFIPYAVEVDGQVVDLFDPVVHFPVEKQPEGLDPRWVLCRRPCVVVGGELEPSMLELRYDPQTGIYMAPVQMKANNGILIIDDFGRQVMSPRQLLNRWIVPLDRKVDYLSLTYGVKFPIPFDVVTVFSTNLNPRQLADDAFFRRIQNKIYVDPCDDAVFDEILRRSARKYGLTITPEIAAFIREQCKRLGQRGLRASYPEDLMRMLKAVCAYEKRPLELSRDVLRRVLELYFAPIEESNLETLV